jgi:two-component sensor histidine kinase
VINALKHAYPDHRRGSISVEYLAKGADWTLSVRDDGVGIAAGSAAAKAGLGTSIVEALAKQLGAVVQIGSAQPGTIVSIVHRGSPPLAPGENHAT